MFSDLYPKRDKKREVNLHFPLKYYLKIESNTPAATAEPITPATLGPIACISKMFPGFSSEPTLETTLAAIGTAEIIHAANRGENFSVIFVNNATYGMTGAQMAPTTLTGQKTTTTIQGREKETTGYPLKISEMLSTLDGTSFICRTSLDSSKNIIATKKAIKKAFQYQLDGKGFSLVEVLSPCPTDWWMGPKEALSWMQKNMISVFPLGVVKDKYSSKNSR